VTKTRPSSKKLTSIPPILGKKASVMIAILILINDLFEAPVSM
jgi:hypothetical protein